jgi:hypothetical protein
MFYFALFVAGISVTQDDYATLSELTLHGFFGPANGVWSNLGGNISSVLPRTLALGFNFSPTLPLGLIIYSAVTLFLIMVSMDHLISSLIPTVKGLAFKFRFPLLLVLGLGFEGIFTPGEVGVLGFSAAAGVHVWPMCFLILGHKLLVKRKPLSGLGAFLAFLYSSNSNIPEGLLTLIAVCVLSYRFTFIDGYHLKGKRMVGAFGLVMSCILAFSFIFLASGFQARSEAVGVSSDPKELILGILNSLLFFIMDILTHPFLYLAFILGNFLGRKLELQFAMKIFRDVCVLTVLYFSLLIVGAGVAYPAWHQTFGLYVFLLPLSFSLGALFSNSIPNINVLVRVLLIPVVIVSSLITVRSGYTNIERKLSWESNFEHNVCVVTGFKPDPLLGSEITYPPKNLGIEDLNTWPWMADAFENWVKGSGFTCRDK